MRSRLSKSVYLALGLVLLWLVLRDIDLAEVSARALSIGWGMAAVLGIYFLAFALDSLTWAMLVPGLALTPTWVYRIWKVRMVGEVLNTLLPAGGMGGEPVKALLLKQHYAIGLRDGATSLVLAKTVNMIALLVFLAIGLALLAATPALAAYSSAGAFGFVAITAGTLGLVAIQLGPVSAFLGRLFHRSPRLAHWLTVTRDLEARMINAYKHHAARLTGAAILALANWALGAVEVYVALIFLNHPVSFGDAWVIEAAAQLLRAGAFFVPAGIGVQEGVFLLLCGLLTGSPEVGVAVALIRRAREIAWLLWGGLIGALFSLTQPVRVPD